VRLLLDTCTVLWWFDDSPRIGPAAASAMADNGNTIMVSIGSLWEIAVKRRSGRLDVTVADVQYGIRLSGWNLLAIQPAHLQLVQGLPPHHRDPFDHLLIAQAIAEDLIIMTDDRHMKLYPVRQMNCAA
jgi:PIN domain nuclease of toxin-antitoxin system